MINKRILIIGGSGALGQALVAKYKENNTVCVFSRDEHKQEDLKLKWPDVRCILGDVKDRPSIDRAILSFMPDVVIQAAALKTVWTCQVNPYESVKTNIIGHQNVIDAVEESQWAIQRLVFVSTDKACNPINVYGMSKAISEQLYVDFAKKQGRTLVHIVRYGNVMNSTRSIIPLFRRLIMEGQDHITITDMKMTRFLLTLDDAIAIIDWSLENSEMTAGNIVVPKVKSVKIVDMMRVIGQAGGIDDIEFRKIPIRDGEKLHEEMVSNFEFQRLCFETDDYFVIGHTRTTESYGHIPYRSDLHLADGYEKERLLELVRDFAENG
jgi:UDP-N-acetylglucosamine 4,6-dehydratase/5-epimerase